MEKNFKVPYTANMQSIIGYFRQVRCDNNDLKAKINKTLREANSTRKFCLDIQSCAYHNIQLVSKDTPNENLHFGFKCKFPNLTGKLFDIMESKNPDLLKAYLYLPYEIVFSQNPDITEEDINYLRNKFYLFNLIDDQISNISFEKNSRKLYYSLVLDDHEYEDYLVQNIIGRWHFQSAPNMHDILENGIVIAYKGYNSRTMEIILHHEEREKQRENDCQISVDQNYKKTCETKDIGNDNETPQNINQEGITNDRFERKKKKRDYHRCYFDDNKS
ncbi:hypothetical protein EDEG_03893 [Edhazardia aedis USNM 41457]|uniref:Uncharacterized protein n=1 Tax=Edhazardia aedis (strain USNM 41457) TaxID=1003232 RepID=J9DJL9_EDHAE|nr:hypothetical protein EDEG_03893 [Edhazardia aedis USNM 41457]|eukprot:EJW01542.1 hypothetical protein EDEG_03893 [Edhazardia aedis USNM 41457]